MKWYVIFYKGVFDPMYHDRVVFTSDIERFIARFNENPENALNGIHVFDHSETSAAIAQVLINRDGVKVTLCEY